MSFSDNEGIVRGGHLKEGTIIHPTAEIVIGIDEDVQMKREFDQETGFDELVVS
jgi:predicted DNA-binding protein with PD1-like motif